MVKLYNKVDSKEVPVSMRVTNENIPGIRDVDPIREVGDALTPDFEETNLNQDNQNQTTIIPDPSHEDPFLCEHDNIVALEGQFSPDTKSLPLSDEKGTSKSHKIGQIFRLRHQHW